MTDERPPVPPALDDPADFAPSADRFLDHKEIETRVNNYLLSQPQGRKMSVEAEEVVRRMMPEGWEWLEHVPFGGPPRIIITRI